MKRRGWLAGVALVALLFGYLHWGPRQTPDGQPPLREITAAGDLQRAFNEAHGRVRVLVMLSPS